MKLSTILEPLLRARVDPDVILEAVRAFEAAQEAGEEEGKEKARARWHKWNDKKQAETNVSKRLPTTANVSGPLTSGDARGENNLLPEEISGKEENKKEAPQAAPRRATRLKADWQIPDAWINEAVAEGMPASEAYAEAQTMLNWSLSDKNGAKLDWHATWQNWFRRILKRRSQGPPGKRRTYADVAMDRVNGHGSESIFGSSGDAQRISARRIESRPDAQDVRGGIAGRFAPSRN